MYRAEVRVKGHPRLFQTFDRQSESHALGEDTEKVLRDNGYIGNAPPADLFFD